MTSPLPNADTATDDFDGFLLSARLLHKLAHAEARVTAAEQRAAAIEASTSWRITGPLRAGLGVVRHAREWLRGRVRDGSETPPSHGSDTAALSAAADPDPERASDAALKQTYRTRCDRELSAALSAGETLHLPRHDVPRVSVILVLHNQAELTFRCLRSLAKYGGDDLEVIIHDNASTDRTAAMLDKLVGAHVVRSAENLHFLRGVNHAAQLARGDHVLLLNNDTEILPGAIAAAAARLDREPTLGAVGGAILQLDGRLQEAGSIIWQNGMTEPYGHREDPEAPEFAFRRDVDYCSGAFLMIRRKLWARLGGFDEAFAPAYFEDADLCMRIREAGLRVGYEPRARILHFGYGSAGSRQAVLALYERNREHFRARHASALVARHCAPAQGRLTARIHGHPAWRVLILDDDPPREDGTTVTFGLRAAVGLHRNSIFITYARLGADVFRDDALRTALETAFFPDAVDLDRFLRDRGGYYSLILPSRDEVSGMLSQVSDVAMSAAAPHLVSFPAIGTGPARLQGAGGA